MNEGLKREITTLHAEVCGALADPKRIMLLYGLSEAPRNVTELSTMLALPQSLVSRHLKVLRERGMVTATRRGASVEYRISDARLITALDLLRAVLHDNLAHGAALATQTL